MQIKSESGLGVPAAFRAVPFDNIIIQVLTFANLYTFISKEFVVSRMIYNVKHKAYYSLRLFKLCKAFSNNALAQL